MAKIIVFGNEKGSLEIHNCYTRGNSSMLQNNNVGIIDLDIRQKSLSRFLDGTDFCKTKVRFTS